LTLLDDHYGDLDAWRRMIDEIHARGMYVVLDNTFATLGDLIGFDGYLNETAPFNIYEHKAVYKTDRTYLDFEMSNDWNETCLMPNFWNETGFPVDAAIQLQFRGCYSSEFDQYGDTEAFGIFPDWRRQLSKFASVQDRLREWHAPTRAKIEVMYSLLISQLDIDGFRYDKAQQATVDAMASMNKRMREVARQYGKENFFISGELTGGNDLGSVYLGRGRQPDQRPNNLTLAVTLTNVSVDVDQYYLREPGYSGLDAHAFSYSLYRSLTRFLGMDGNLEAGYDVPRNWVDMHNTFLMTNDLVNPMTGKSCDVRHMYGVTNQDVSDPLRGHCAVCARAGVWSRLLRYLLLISYRCSDGLASTMARRESCSVISLPQSTCRAYLWCYGEKIKGFTCLIRQQATISMAANQCRPPHSGKAMAAMHWTPLNTTTCHGRRHEMVARMTM
jgi:alpha-1,3-glucan synthase